jgi:hypothetical protein
VGEWSTLRPGHFTLAEKPAPVEKVTGWLQSLFGLLEKRKVSFISVKVDCQPVTLSLAICTNNAKIVRRNRSE